jgi:hypothetical protein
MPTPLGVCQVLSVLQQPDDLDFDFASKRQVPEDACTGPASYASFVQSFGQTLTELLPQGEHFVSQQGE